VICHKVSTEGSPLSSHKERALPTNGVRKEPLQVLDGHAEQVESDLVVLENVERGRYSKPKVGKGIAEKPDRTKGVVLCLPPPPERVSWPRRRGDVIEELVLVVDTRETTVQIVLKRELDSINALRVFAHHASEQGDPTNTHHRPGLQFHAKEVEKHVVGAPGGLAMEGVGQGGGKVREMHFTCMCSFAAVEGCGENAGGGDGSLSKEVYGQPPQTTDFR
jgi:hypothetical protein